MAVSALVVLARSVVEASLGVFEFGSAGGILLVAALALTGLVLVTERPTQPTA